MAVEGWGGNKLGLDNADENSQFKDVLVRLVCTSNGSSEESLVSQHGRQRPWEPVIIRQCSSTKYLSAGNDYITGAEPCTRCGTPARLAILAQRKC